MVIIKALHLAPWLVGLRRELGLTQLGNPGRGLEGDRGAERGDVAWGPTGRTGDDLGASGDHH